MIVAEIYTQSDGKIAAFVLRGHSNTAAPGYDVHCAAVSMLSQSAYLGIRKYLNRDVTANHEHGGLGIELKNSPDELTEAIFQTMLIGLKAVEKEAPQIFKIETVKMDKSAEENLQSKISSMNQSRGKALPKLDVREVKISAEIYRNADGKIIGLAVEEHDTDFVNEFKIYRAGVWALMRAGFSCVKDYLKRDLESETNSRRLVMKLKNPPDEVTEAVFQTCLIGIREVEKLAPQIIRLEEKMFGGEINELHI